MYLYVRIYILICVYIYVHITDDLYPLTLTLILTLSVCPYIIGTFKVSKNAFNLGDIIQDPISVVESILNLKNITVILKTSDVPHVTPVLMGDRKRYELYIVIP
jgi:hypothetical protein